MIQRLGATGILGFLLLLGGIVLVALESYVIAAGLALMVAGLGLTVRALIQNVMSAMGMGGMLGGGGGL